MKRISIPVHDCTRLSFKEYLNCILKAPKAFDTCAMYNNSSNKNAVVKRASPSERCACSAEAWSPASPQRPPAPRQSETWAWSMCQLSGGRHTGQRSAEVIQPLSSHKLQPVCKGKAVSLLCFRAQTQRRGSGKVMCALLFKVKCGRFRRGSLLSLLLSSSL